MTTSMRGANTREAIRGAATQLFLEHGYSKTSVRGIASLAGVDPALVVRYFGSKEELFIQVTELARDESSTFDGDLSRLGERVVRQILEADESVRSTYVALIRASNTGSVGATLRALHESRLVGPLMSAMSAEHPELRARLVASAIGGLLYSLWVIGDDALAAAPVDDVVALYAPVVQTLIEG